MGWTASYGTVDAGPGTTEDRLAADGVALRYEPAGAGVDDLSEQGEHKATRIIDHPMLGRLMPASTVAFTFNGALVEGRMGEPLAAALIAAGFRVFRTMPRFGDARGGYCMVARCADCQVVVDGVPNVPACATPIAAGMDVRTQHGLGGREVDGQSGAEP